jgi:hypothetical protein
MEWQRSSWLAFRWLCKLCRTLQIKNIVDTTSDLLILLVKTLVPEKIATLCFKALNRLAPGIISTAHHNSTSEYFVSPQQVRSLFCVLIQSLSLVHSLSWVPQYGILSPWKIQQCSSICFWWQLVRLVAVCSSTVRIFCCLFMHLTSFVLWFFAKEIKISNYWPGSTSFTPWSILHQLAPVLHRGLTCTSLYQFCTMV